MKRSIYNSESGASLQTPTKRACTSPSRCHIHMSKVRDGDDRWNGTEYTIFQAWKKDIIDEFCSAYNRDPNDQLGNIKAFKVMCRRLISRNETTPGSVACAELVLLAQSKRYQPYLHNFVPEWETDEFKGGIAARENSFVSGLYQASLCSSKFMVSVLDHWSAWCKQHNVTRTSRSFYQFASTMEADSRIISGILHHIYTFVVSFSHLFIPDNARPVAVPSSAAQPYKEEPPTPEFESNFLGTESEVDLRTMDDSFESEPLLSLSSSDDHFTEEEIKDYIQGDDKGLAPNEVKIEP